MHTMCTEKKKYTVTKTAYVPKYTPCEENEDA